MEGKWVFGSVVISCLTGIAAICVYKGIDGGILTTIVGTITGIAGFLLGLPINLTKNLE